MLPFWSSLLAPLALTALHAAADVEFQMMPSIDRWSSSSTDLRPMRALHDSRQPFQMPLCRMHELEEASIETIQSWLEAGSLNSAQLVICYLERIHQLNKHLSAVLEVNPDAHNIAQQLDVERASGALRGPLHGIPFLLKDNIASKDKMETTAGSFALLGSVVPRDAHIVKLLREEGAVLLGKTNCDSWACIRNRDTCTAYSARGGRMYNAYNLSSHPWGSSSGSAQAVATNMAAFAIGTETGGSIIGPARRAGIVGIKPTLGLTSRAGVIPVTLRQDVVGPFGKTVRDATLVLEGMVGPDRRDKYTLRQLGRVPNGRNYRQFLADKTSLKGAVFGIPWETIWKTPSAKNDIEPLLKVIDKLRSAGAIIINGTEMLHTVTSIRERPYLQHFRYRWDVDILHDMRFYLAELNNTDIRSIQDIVDYNLRYDEVEGGRAGTVPGFWQGQDGLLQALATRGERNASYWENEAAIERMSKTEGIDYALSNAVVGGTPQRIEVLLSPSSIVDPSCMSGYPTVTLPVAVSAADSVPIGLSLIGTAWSEPVLIKYASTIEDLLDERPQPRFHNVHDRNKPVDRDWQPL